MEEEISFIQLFGIFKKRFLLIAGLGLVGVTIAALFTFFIATPKYSSTTQILVSRTQAGEVIQQSDINTNLQLINTYKDIIKGPVILDDVLQKLDLEETNLELANKIEIGNHDNSQVFSLIITDDNPYQAADIANIIAQTFQENIYEIMNVDNVTIISEAIPRVDPVSPNTDVNLAIGLVFGLIIGMGLSFLYEYLDNTVKEENFITDVLNWTNLGTVLEMSASEIKETRIAQNTRKRKINPSISRRV